MFISTEEDHAEMQKRHTEGFVMTTTEASDELPISVSTASVPELSECTVTVSSSPGRELVILNFSEPEEAKEFPLESLDSLQVRMVESLGDGIYVAEMLNLTTGSIISSGKEGTTSRPSGSGRRQDGQAKDSKEDTDNQ